MTTERERCGGTPGHPAKLQERKDGVPVGQWARHCLGCEDCRSAIPAPITTDAVGAAQSAVLDRMSDPLPASHVMLMRYKAAIVARERERHEAQDERLHRAESLTVRLLSRIAELESNLVIAHNNCDVLTETVDRRVETIRQQQARIEALEAVVEAARLHKRMNLDGEAETTDQSLDAEQGLVTALAALDKQTMQGGQG